MKDSGLIPIRIYREFTSRDWPDIPKPAQDALATFLLELQKNPDDSEVVAHAQRDAAGRLGYEFSPGYVVYWRIVRNEPGQLVQPLRIEVLAIVKTGIKVSETRQESGPGGDSSTAEEQDLIEKVYSRTASLGNLAMWGIASRQPPYQKGQGLDCRLLVPRRAAPFAPKDALGELS